jgi:hypothetical protein
MMANKIKLTKENLSQVNYGDSIIYNNFVGTVAFDQCAPGGMVVDGMPLMRILENYNDVFLVEK